MKWYRSRVGAATAAAMVLAWSAAFAHASRAQFPGDDHGHEADKPVDDNVHRLIDEGRRVFRYETFGDEAFWGDTLKLHRAIEGTTFGGVGPGVSPKTALAVGLKVDVDALPPQLLAALGNGQVDLNDPASTLALIKANAVVGITGHFDAGGGLTSMGVQCALCHSTVDNSFAPGIGHRLDGWANRDLNVGAIVSLAPDLSALTTLLGVDEITVRKVLESWGPGKFDAELNLDGKAFRPDGGRAATLIPPAFGLAGVNLHTWGGGWGTITYWNAFVANLEMNGRGNFFDERLDNPISTRLPRKRDSATNSPTTIRSRSISGAAVLSARAAGPCAKPGSFDERPRHAARRSSREGALLHLPRAADLHRGRLEHAQGGGDRDRRLPGKSIAGSELPHRSTAGPDGPRQGRLLSRRPLPGSRRRRRSLQPVLQARTDGCREARSDRVP